MKNYGVNELRKMYLDFFESKQHLKMDSFPLVPKNDNSLLLINAGMAPLKPYFTGQETPPSKRVTTCQKCIRTGDIENVGKTDRHGTFFEMLGNFSFGDYFKEEAIQWAYEFFVDVLEIPAEKLYISVYLEDDEAEKIWIEKTGIPKERIVRLGKEDNFWEHGSGPCGPCTEIHYDRGEEHGCDSPTCGVGSCDCDRYVEVWNLVFTQFERTDDGEYLDLPNPNIDTGMGLERLAVVMQDAGSFFDIDTMKAIRDEICRIANVEYGKVPKEDVSVRVITDHIRSVSFMTSDGILPSNEGRGYVLRRLLRRAARHGKLLGIKGNFLAELSKIVIESSKDAYPELAEKAEYIYKILSVEEERFAETIDKGLAILKGYIEALEDKGYKTLSGVNAFTLYDTYGFPLDLTVEILEEKDMTVDEEAFKAAMEEQRTRAREAREETNYMGAKETIYNQLDADLQSDFVGYDHLEYKSPIVALTTENEIVEKVVKGQKASVIVAETPFYATSGGQMNDFGDIKTETGTFIVEDVVKVMGNKIAHVGVVEAGEITMNQEAELIVDATNRALTAKNHSTTHLLQKALKNVLGNHIEQAGSNVNANRLRFDFTHFEAMSAEEVAEVEADVNEAIAKGLEINVKEMPIEEAKKAGAMALFGEKYGDVVRVVNMGDYSVELCGGTHLTNTRDAALFKIVSETGVAAGVRRIEAITSTTAIEYYKKQESTLVEIAKLIKSEPTLVAQKVTSLLNDYKAALSENEKLKSKLASGAVDDLLSQKVAVGEVELLAAEVKDVDANALRDMGDKFKEKLTNGVVVLATDNKGKVNLVVMAADSAVKLGAHAGNIIREAAKVVGGGGGGRPNMAQAGGKDPSKIGDALAKAKEVLEGQL